MQERLPQYKHLNIAGQAVGIFSGQSDIDYLQRPGVTSDLRRLLLAPDDLTIAFAQLVTVSWDRRNNSLNARRGTLIGAAVEHVRAYPGEDRNQLGP